METPAIIAQKAHELFLNYGLRSVTMDTIATELGIGKSTIYKFFESKDALVEHFVEQAIQQNTGNCKAFIKQGKDPIIELFFTMIYVQQLYQELTPAILHDLEKNHHKAYLAVIQHKEGFIIETIKTSIEKGIKQQLYQDDFNVAAMSRFFLESLLLISDKQIFSATAYKSIDLMEEIFGHLISGIATPAGTDVITHYKNHYRFTSVIPALKQPFWED
ncbi:TetR/AcrR family transcriptional regulator [Mucilaginibacter sp.]|uniref:TetR/AcrR family transcriptional regulator n=1 Tax=Mucilaginibacter sp. TaxID=1882438 RepID=UPI003D11856C